MGGYTEYKISWFLKTKKKNRLVFVFFLRKKVNNQITLTKKKRPHRKKKCLPRKSKVSNQFHHLHYSEINKSNLICSVENYNPKWCKLNFERVTNEKLKTKCTENVEQRMRWLDELQSSTEWNPPVAAPHSGGVQN